MPEIIRNEALELFNQSVNATDRVVIAGGSGWFGKTSIAMAKASHLPYMVTGSKARTIDFCGYRQKVEPHDLGAIRAFKPTIVIDAAFLTREKALSTAQGSYVKTNEELIQMSIELAKLSDLRKYIGFSSGAAIHKGSYESFELKENPYAALKIKYEKIMRDIASTVEASVSIPRVYSVTGAFNGQPSNYAYSNLILQALLGDIRIDAGHKVLRSYSPVEDVIAVAMAGEIDQNFPVFETGGEAIEIGALAKLAIEVTGSKGRIHRPEVTSASSDVYCSKSSEWLDSLTSLGIRESSIADQMERATKHLALISTD